MVKLDKFKQFSTFKQSFSSNVYNLKRRFSSGDLSSEQDNEDQSQQQQPQPPPGSQTASSADSTSPKATPSQSSSSVTNNVNVPPANLNITTTTTTASSNPTSMFNSSKTTSAPTSPAKGSSFLTRVQSLTGVAREYTSNITSQVISTANQYGVGGGGTGSGSGLMGGRMLPAREIGIMVLLVIDDMNTDWSKYFKTRKVHECEIRVEQCEFNELSVTAMEGSCAVSYAVWKEGNRVVKQFVPDMVLIRQNLKDAGRDYKNQLLSLMYGGVPGVNSLAAVYNFQDKPWVFAHMMNIQRKFGRDSFPLIDQCFYPDFKEMTSYIPKLPAVLKIGHAHGGLGKIRVGTINDYQDASSVVAVTGTYCTSEPYVEARCDVHVQKIGNQYKAFMRKGIVGHWKSGSGSAMLEQIQMNDRYRAWVDNVATLFGGLDICALEVIVGKDGREYIIEVNDSALSLMGESQEEDRRLIAELVLSRMNQQCKPYTGGSTAGGIGVAPLPPSQQQLQQQQQQAGGTRYRRTSGSEQEPDPAAAPNVGPSPSISRRESQVSTASGAQSSGGSVGAASTSTQPNSTTSGYYSGSGGATSNPPPSASSTKTSFFSRQNSQASASGVSIGSAGSGAAAGTAKEGGTGEDTEDTMKNLRKTFAGIFGDM